MIQVQVEDKEATSFSALELKRRIKGSGVEVDMGYQPIKVAPGRFVGRGFATERARNKVLSTARDVVLFKELKVADGPVSPRNPDQTIAAF